MYRIVRVLIFYVEARSCRYRSVMGAMNIPQDCSPLNACLSVSNCQNQESDLRATRNCIKRYDSPGVAETIESLCPRAKVTRASCVSALGPDYRSRAKLQTAKRKTSVQAGNPRVHLDGGRHKIRDQKPLGLETSLPPTAGEAGAAGCIRAGCGEAGACGGVGVDALAAAACWASRACRACNVTSSRSCICCAVGRSSGCESTPGSSSR